MNEDQLFRTSLIGSILGILVLYFIAMNIPATDVNTDEVGSNWITGSFAASVVKMKGEVKDFYEHSNGHYFFNLEYETGEGKEEIRTVIWQQDVEGLKLSGVKMDEIRDGTVVEITGTIEMYKGEPELIPLRSHLSNLNFRFP
ncbi:exodeoxyribonuclease VII large subunit [Candidatus Aenigmatarchaeota archaeon]